MEYYFEIGEREIKVIPFSEMKRGGDAINLVYLRIPDNLQHLAALGRELPISPREVASKIFEKLMYQEKAYGKFPKKYEGMKLGVSIEELLKLLPDIWSEARSLVENIKEKDLADKIFDERRQKIVSVFIKANPPLMKIFTSDYSWDVSGELAIYENYAEMEQKMAAMMPDDMFPFGIGSLESAASAVMADHWDDGTFEVVQPPATEVRIAIFYSGHWEVSFCPDGQIVVAQLVHNGG